MISLHSTAELRTNSVTEDGGIEAPESQVLNPNGDLSTSGDGYQIIFSRKSVAILFCQQHNDTLSQ